MGLGLGLGLGLEMNDFSFVKTGGSFHQRAGGPNQIKTETETSSH